jgi:DNA-binding NtrC family response regulator
MCHWVIPDLRSCKLSRFKRQFVATSIYGQWAQFFNLAQVNKSGSTIEADNKQVNEWQLASVLVVDDEPGMRHFLEKTLSPRVGHVRVAASAEEGADLFQRHRFDLVILDISLPGMSGIVWSKRLRDEGFEGDIILITAFADLETAIEALRAGASDFLLKPFRVTQLLNSVRRGLERTQLKRENWVLRRSLSQRLPSADGLIGHSIVVKGLQSALQRVAAVHSTVLLTGESGTGKELAALALHRLGPNSMAPFVPVHCATMSPTLIESELFGQAGWTTEGHKGHDGLFVYAQGGTLFLDEIGDLPLTMQASFLRVLESRFIRPVGSEHEVPVNARIIAATSRPLADEVAAGRFRKDLYYRLQVVEIRLPPLREHKEDIPDLVQHFLKTLAPQLGVPTIDVTHHELEFLAKYDWPGNVRELRNLIERSLIVGSLNVSALYKNLNHEMTPAAATPMATKPTDLHALEKQHIIAVLESVAGDKTRAAELLGVSRRTLERRVAEWAEAGARSS